MPLFEPRQRLSMFLPPQSNQIEPLRVFNSACPRSKTRPWLRSPPPRAGQRWFLQLCQCAGTIVSYMFFKFLISGHVLFRASLLGFTLLPPFSPDHGAPLFATRSPIFPLYSGAYDINRQNLSLLHPTWPFSLSATGYAQQFLLLGEDALGQTKITSAHPLPSPRKRMRLFA